MSFHRRTLLDPQDQHLPLGPHSVPNIGQGWMKRVHYWKTAKITRRVTTSIDLSQLSSYRALVTYAGMIPPGFQWGKGFSLTAGLNLNINLANPI